MQDIFQFVSLSCYSPLSSQFSQPVLRARQTISLKPPEGLLRQAGLPKLRFATVSAFLSVYKALFVAIPPAKVSKMAWKWIRFL